MTAPHPTSSGDSDLLEKLAAIEHERWSDWQAHVFKNCGTFNADGSFTIQPDRVERMQRQISTPYADLSRSEQEADIREVQRYWPLVQAYRPTSSGDGKLRHRLMLLAAKHDAMPRASWHKTSDNSYVADTPEAAYKKWMRNFANDALQLIEQECAAREEAAHASSTLAYLETLEPTEVMHFLGIIVYKYIMEPTNATDFATTLHGFSHKGQVLGDMRVEVQLTQAQGEPS